MKTSAPYFSWQRCCELQSPDLTLSTENTSPSPAAELALSPKPSTKPFQVHVDETENMQSITAIPDFEDFFFEVRRFESL